MKNRNFSQSKPFGGRTEPYFTPAPARMLDVPVIGSIETYDRYPPRVRYAGTLWRFKVQGGSSSVPLTHRQSVTILGRQGNWLLIEV